MSQGSPLITTVIPTYRRPRLLRRAIYSVLNQTYPNLEVLVYDNASGDETADMCAEIAARDHRVKYLCHSQNIGVLNNFQAALQEVRTSFFSILSDDDVLLPEFYETALTAFDRHPDAIFVATRVVGMDSLGRAYPMAELTALPGYYSPRGDFKKCCFMVILLGRAYYSGKKFVTRSVAWIWRRELLPTLILNFALLPGFLL